ncbi:MAG: aminomethyltransferase family protein [Acidobacteriia bacterium]|nr:aminomethyltransferase family protein [Terriglobia bacterium]
MKSRTTPLHEAEAAAGACFEPYCGWEVAAHYGNPDAEYQALRLTAGALNACFLGKLRAAGKDRHRYLNSMLTHNIKDLGMGTGCYAALLTRQGLMESDLWVYAFADELWLECPPCGVDRALATLAKHIVSDVVSLDDITDAFGILSLQGPKAGKIMETAAGVSLSTLRPLEHRTIERERGNWVVVNRDRSGSGGYDLWLPCADLPGVWNQWTEVERVQPVGLRALNWARTEAGIPWYGSDMDDRSLPVEMGLDAAISMNKGCYRGQEIVARIAHRGRLDRRLGGVVVDNHEPPARGAEVRSEGVRIGEVCSAVPSPRLGKPLALAVIKTAFLRPGTPVEVDSGHGYLPGTVVALPIKH